MSKTSKDISNRKEFLVAGAAALTATLASDGLRAQSKHHHHGNTKESRVQSTALDCVRAGEICIAHCIQLMKKNDTSLVNCMVTVDEAVAACIALSRLAANNSRHLKEFAEACIDICKSCEKECRKHASKHTSCRECAEACAACIKACKAL